MTHRGTGAPGPRLKSVQPALGLHKLIDLYLVNNIQHWKPPLTFFEIVQYIALLNWENTNLPETDKLQSVFISKNK